MGFGSNAHLPNQAIYHTYNYVWGTGSGEYLFGKTNMSNIIHAGGGNDRVAGGGLPDYIYLGDGNDIAYGFGSTDHIYAGEGNDHVYGGDAPDFIYGEGGNDTLEGGAGADLIDGGAGQDTASYIGSSAGVRIEMLLYPHGEVEATAFGGDAEGDTLKSIEKIEGSQHADSIIFKSNPLVGGPGGVAWGRGGDDFLRGGASDDVLYGGDGRDTLIGGFGADYLFGDAGNDKIYDHSPSTADADYVTPDQRRRDKDFLAGGEGDDLIISHYGADQLFGENGDDTFILVTGQGRGDWVYGGSGRDTLVLDSQTGPFTDSGAGAYVDTQEAFAWLDFRGSTAGLDAARAAELGNVAYINQIEVVIGTDHTDYIFGSAENEEFHGGGGDDWLQGRGGADILRGGDGYNWIDGGSGQDFITIQGDVDIVWGGAHEDIFVIEQSSGDYGLIYDYQDGVDTIDLFRTKINNFADLMDSSDGDGLTGSGAGWILLATEGGSEQLVVYGMTLDNISSDDFNF